MSVVQSWLERHSNHYRKYKRKKRMKKRREKILIIGFVSLGDGNFLLIQDFH